MKDVIVITAASSGFGALAARALARAGQNWGNEMAQQDRSIRIESGLQDKRIVVLGGSSGIGLEVAKLVVEQEGEVVIASSNAERVKQAVTSLGVKTEGHTLDLTDERAIQTFFKQLGSFDHLVFTAGDTLQLGELAVVDLKKARRAFELRYWAALAAAKYGSAHIRAGGSIVLTTGIAGQRPRKGWVIGASVCGTVEALTRALAVELAPVRVNAVSPGLVRTNLWQNMQEHEREGMYESVGKTLLVGRVGEASDIARAYLFLVQEGFSTGQIVVVDGGTLLV
jgi:NAD(P)-dependent dehydrogenase (short-subunit alcohol dehydrogenase family)